MRKNLIFLLFISFCRFVHKAPQPKIQLYALPSVAGMVKPPAMVVEYMGARSLRGCLNRGSDMLSTPLSRVMVALDVAKGMEYLHNKSVVHLDLKSGNVCPDVVLGLGHASMEVGVCRVDHVFTIC